jgi:hypothetical protein
MRQVYWLYLLVKSRVKLSIYKIKKAASNAAFYLSE